MCLCAALVSAEESSVPAALQSKLLVRAAVYDRNFSKRAGERAAIWVVTTESAESAQFAGQLRQALAEEPVVGGLPHDEVVVPFAGAAALAVKVKAEKPAIVFLAPGVNEPDVKALVSALTGADVLLASANPARVISGVSLGFDLVSGKPRLLVNLKQAQKQGVAFGADLLRLAQVVDP